MNKKMDETIRDNRLDLIRVIAMLMVFAHHTERNPLKDGALTSSICSAVLLLCNGLFFMLSGQLNLSRRFEDIGDTIRFYLNRLVTIVLPFFLVSLLTSVLETISADDSLSLLHIIKSCYVEFFGAHSKTYLWFVYWLVGFIFSTPILAKAFRQMSDKELTLIFAVALAWNFVSVYMTADLGVDFGFNGWILNGWIIAYYAGYYCSRVINSQNEKLLYIAGILSFVVTILGEWLIPEHFFNPHDLSPAYTLYAMTVYYILSRKLKAVSGKRLNVILLFAAKHSYTAYLIHRIVHNSIKHLLLGRIHSNTLYFFCVFASISIISLMIAFVTDELLIFPATKRLKRYLAVK